MICFRALMLAFIMLFILTLQAQAAQNITITTGGEQGTYFKKGHQLAGMLKNNAYTFNVAPSKGSVDNIEKIANGEAHIGFTQMDAFAKQVASNPAIATKVDIVGPTGQECVFLVVNKAGDIRSEDDLQTNKANVAIGEPGSGSISSWEYMMLLEPGYKKASVTPTGGLKAIGKLAMTAGGKDQPNAVIFVSAPDPENSLIKTVVNNKNLAFLDVDDSDLNDKFPLTGRPVYEFKKVKVSNAMFGGTVSTICMDAAVIASTELPPQLSNRLTEVILNYTLGNK